MTFDVSANGIPQDYHRLPLHLVVPSLGFNLQLVQVRCQRSKRRTELNLFFFYSTSSTTASAAWSSVSAAPYTPTTPALGTVSDSLTLTLCEIHTNLDCSTLVPHLPTRSPALWLVLSALLPFSFKGFDRIQVVGKGQFGRLSSSIPLLSRAPVRIARFPMAVLALIS